MVFDLNLFIKGRFQKQRPFPRGTWLHPTRDRKIFNVGNVNELDNVIFTVLLVHLVHPVAECKDIGIRPAQPAQHIIACVSDDGIIQLVAQQSLGRRGAHNHGGLKNIQEGICQEQSAAKAQKIANTFNGMGAVCDKLLACDAQRNALWAQRGAKDLLPAIADREPRGLKCIELRDQSVEICIGQPIQISVCQINDRRENIEHCVNTVRQRTGEGQNLIARDEQKVASRGNNLKDGLAAHNEIKAAEGPDH